MGLAAGGPPDRLHEGAGGKTTKNRMHLDWSAADREAEVQRLLGLGATRLWDVKEKVGEGDMEWTALADSEGNEFCVIQSDPPSDRHLATLVLDADDLQRVGRFWEIALERELEQLEPDKYVWLPSDPPLTVVRVPEPRTHEEPSAHRLARARSRGRGRAPNRARRDAPVGRHERELRVTTLADVEGNEFCVVQAESS